MQSVVHHSFQKPAKPTNQIFTSILLSPSSKRITVSQPRCWQQQKKEGKQRVGEHPLNTTILRCPELSAELRPLWLVAGDWGDRMGHTLLMPLNCRDLWVHHQVLYALRDWKPSLGKTQRPHWRTHSRYKVEVNWLRPVKSPENNLCSGSLHARQVG